MMNRRTLLLAGMVCCAAGCVAEPQAGCALETEEVAYQDRPVAFDNSIGDVAYLLPIEHKVGLADGTLAELLAQPTFAPEAPVTLSRDAACLPELHVTVPVAVSVSEGRLDVETTGEFKVNRATVSPLGVLTAVLDADAWSGPIDRPEDVIQLLLTVEVFNYEAGGSVLAQYADHDELLVHWDAAE